MAADLPRRAAWALWLPVLGVMALIFWGSSQPSEDLPGLFAIPHLDKVAHLIEYGVLGLTLARPLGRSLRGYALIAAVAAIALAYGVTDEVHQISVPGRDFSIMDMTVDLIGAALGAACWTLMERWVWLRRWR